MPSGKFEHEHGDEHGHADFAGLQHREAEDGGLRYSVEHRPQHDRQSRPLGWCAADVLAFPVPEVVDQPVADGEHDRAGEQPDRRPLEPALGGDALGHELEGDSAEQHAGTERHHRAEAPSGSVCAGAPRPHRSAATPQAASPQNSASAMAKTSMIAAIGQLLPIGERSRVSLSPSRGMTAVGHSRTFDHVRIGGRGGGRITYERLDDD
jgi:hypothetical protein